MKKFQNTNIFEEIIL